MAMSPRLLRPLASGFNPRQIAGLSAWYDASVASSLTLTSGFVSQWDDLSGSGLHLTQATEANRPGTGTINGKTAVDFDGSNDLMQVTADVFPGTLMVVGSLDSIAASAMAAFAADAATNSANAFWISSPAQWRLVGFDASIPASYAHSGGTALASQPVLATVLHGASNVSRIDGAPLAGTTNVTGGNTQGVTVGARVISGSPSTLWNGQIGEVLLFNRVLTASEVSKAESYLASKWGVTLA
jgi:hypothetical protein